MVGGGSERESNEWRDDLLLIADIPWSSWWYPICGVFVFGLSRSSVRPPQWVSDWLTGSDTYYRVLNIAFTISNVAPCDDACKIFTNGKQGQRIQWMEWSGRMMLLTEMLVGSYIIQIRIRSDNNLFGNLIGRTRHHVVMTPCWNLCQFVGGDEVMACLPLNPNEQRGLPAYWTSSWNSPILGTLFTHPDYGLVY